MLDVLSNPSAALFCPATISGGVSYFSSWEHFFVVPSRVTRSFAEITWIDPDRMMIRASVPPPAASGSTSAVPDPGVAAVVAEERSPSPIAQEVAATLADEGTALEASSKKRGISATVGKGKEVEDVPLIRKKGKKDKTPTPSPLRSIRLLSNPQEPPALLISSSLPTGVVASADPPLAGVVEEARRSPPPPSASGALVAHPEGGAAGDDVVNVASSSSHSAASGEGFVAQRRKVPSSREVFPDLEEVVRAPRNRRVAVPPGAEAEPYVPGWGIRNSDSLTNIRTARRVIEHAAPPATAAEVGSYPDGQVRDDLCQCLAYTVAYAAEGLNRWSDQIRVGEAYQVQAAIWKDRFNQRDMELDIAEVQVADAQALAEERGKRIASLEKNAATLQSALTFRTKETDRLESMLREATSRPVIGEGQMVVDTSEMTALTSQVDTLKAEVSSLQASLTLRDAEMARLRSMSADRFSQHQREVEALKKEVEEARVGNEALKKEAAGAQGAYQWVVEHGLKEFVGKLHRSSEFLTSRTRLCDAARAVGFAEGVREGIRSVPSKTPLSRVRLYDPAAADKYDEMLLTESSEKFPYLEALAASAGQPVEELQKIQPSSPSME